MVQAWTGSQLTSADMMMCICNQESLRSSRRPSFLSLHVIFRPGNKVLKKIRDSQALKKRRHEKRTQHQVLAHKFIEEQEKQTLKGKPKIQIEGLGFRVL